MGTSTPTALNPNLNFKNALASTLVAAAFLTGCSNGRAPGSAIDGSSLNVAAIRADSSLTPAQKAERLATAAERLVTPTSFMYADEIASQALEIDPQNTRARFWRAALGPAMAGRGLVARIEPLAKKNSRRWMEYRKAVGSIRQHPEKDVVQFLLDGPKDIANESDVQEFVAVVTSKLDKARETMKEIKETELVVRLNTESLKQAAMDRKVRSCRVTTSGNGVYQFENCEFSEAYEVRLNQADFEMIQQSIAGYQVYLTLLNSIDLSGAFAVAERGTDASPEQVARELLQNPKFGRLRDGRAIGAIPTLLKDAVMGVRYAQSIQGELCPSDRGQLGPVRPGYLFEGGLCLEPSNETDAALRTIETLLSGTPVVIPFTIGQRTVPVMADVAGFFSNPIKDVRELLPLQRNECGSVIGAGDGKLGGLFPTGDLNVILAAHGCER